MLLQKYCSSISAVYAAAAGRRCGPSCCRRYPTAAATAAACCSCTTTADCLTSACCCWFCKQHFAVLCVYVYVCIIISFCIMIRSLWTCITYHAHKIAKTYPAETLFLTLFISTAINKTSFKLSKNYFEQICNCTSCEASKYQVTL